MSANICWSEKEENKMEEEEVEIKNALITDTMLGVDKDHGIFTCWLYLDYGGSGQGFGGYALDVYDPTSQKRVSCALGMDFLSHVLEIVGVSKWEDLKGKHLRVKASRSKYGIGHILNEKWFYPKDLFSSKEG